MNTSLYTHVSTIYLFRNMNIEKYGKNSKTYLNVKGLWNWDSADTVLALYFYTYVAMTIDLFLRCKVPSTSKSKSEKSVHKSNSKTNLLIDGPDFKDYKVGTFNVSKGYHKLKMRGVSKSGQYFADVSQAMIGQFTEQNNVKYLEQYSDWQCTGLSLWYGLKTTNVLYGDNEYFYNEVTVPDGYDPPTSYIMAVGFTSKGYFGIQSYSRNEKRIIFSVWAPQKTNKLSELLPENNVTLIRKGGNAYNGLFGGEGVGSNAIQKYWWKTNTTYKFLVRGRPDPKNKTRTEFTAWYASDDNVWHLQASFSQPKAGFFGGRYLRGFYSFLEDWNGNTPFETRKAYYGNQWVRDLNGKWIEIREARYGPLVGGRNNIRRDVDGGNELINDKYVFYLKTGGLNFDGQSPYRKTYYRTELKVPPKIDLDKLP